MSLFDSASLCITPNGYKEDKLYSIKPTDGSGDLVVTRATTATRVNSDGLIEVTPYNLLQRSEEFNNAIWVKSASAITANATTAPNGTLTAEKIIEESVTSQHRIDQTPSTSIGTYTFSVFAKKAERDSVWLRIGLSGAYFDLTNGTISGMSGVTASIENVGNGWYKCIIVRTTTAENEIARINLAIGTNGTYLGNGTSGLFIWGAQLVTGTSAKEYFPTTDRLDVPRLDYTNSSCPSILVEPQRTNLILRSQEFDNASWTKPGVNVTANNTISPTGLTDAELLTTSASGINGVYQFISTGSGTFSFSVFAKKGNNNYFALNVQADSSNNCTAVFDLSDGTLGEYQTEGSTAYISHKIESYGNGWYRCTIVFSTTSSIPYFFPMFAPLKTGNTFTSSGEVNGNTSGKTLYLFGAQLEVGSYATSYVPTVASSVTRNADQIFKTGISSLIGQTEGTIFMDFIAQQTTGLNQSHIWIGSSGNEIGIYGGAQLIFYSSGGVSINAGSYTTGERYKIAFAYKNNDYVVYINGVLKGVDTSASVPTTSNLSINSYFDGSEIQKKQINSAMLFKTRLSNTELAQLTTI